MTGFEICPDCGAAIMAPARRCPRCGAAQGAPAPPRQERAVRRAVAFIALLTVAGLALALTALTRDRSRSFLTSIAHQIPGVITLVTYDVKDRELSQGSGFLLTPDGLAASNFHVLEDAARADATLGDGRRFQVVRVHAFDADRDLVVFQLGRPRGRDIERPSGLHALTLGATSGLKVGDHIATISSPKGLSNTVSDGLVSAIRDDDGQRLIQISAPISPGSSGGPVFDLSGKVVGIATLQMSEGQNLNFATPIDSLRHILPRRENLTLGEFRKRARTAAGEDDEFTRAFDTGRRLHHRGAWRRAVRWYLYAEVLDPDEPSTFYNAGLCYIELNEKQRAAEQFYRYLGLAEDDDPDRAEIEDWLADNRFRVPKRSDAAP